MFFLDLIRQATSKITNTYIILCLGFAIFASQDVLALTFFTNGCGQMFGTGTDAPADHLVLQVDDTCNRLFIEAHIDYTEIPFFSAWENVTWQDAPNRTPTDTAYVEAINPAQVARIMTVRTLTVNDVFLDTEINRFEFKGNPTSLSVNDGGSISLARNPLMLVSQDLTIGTATGSGLIRDFGGNQFPSTTFSVAAGATLQLLDSGALTPSAPASSRLNFTTPDKDNAADIQGILNIHRSYVILPTDSTEMLVHNGGQLLVSGSNGTALETGKIRLDGGSLQAATGNNTVDVEDLLLNDAQVSLGDTAQIHASATIATGNNTITLGDNAGFPTTQLFTNFLAVEGPLVLEGFAKLTTERMSMDSFHPAGLVRITESATLEIIASVVESDWSGGSVEIGPDAWLHIESGGNLSSRIPIQNDGRIIVAGKFQPSGVMSGNGDMRIQALGKLGPFGGGAATTLTASPNIFMDPLSTFEVVITPSSGSSQQLIANSIFALNPLGTVLKLTLSADTVLPHGTKFVIVDYPDGNNLFGHFTRQDRSLLYEGDLITAGLNTYMLSYADPSESGSSAITLTVQPHAAADSATFKVIKAYSDGNTAQVDVSLACSGLPDQLDTISPGNPATFILDGFDSGTVSCEITESGGPDGYIPSFLTNEGNTSGTSCVFATVETDHNYACGITNTKGLAHIKVTKQFKDLPTPNLEDTVIVTLQCDSGTYAPATAELGHNETHTFVIYNLPVQGPPVSCWVTEDGVEGYDGVFICKDDNGPDSSCSSSSSETDRCLFNDVVVDGVGVGDCTIQNSPAPVDVDVTKVWEEAGALQSDLDPDVRISLFCDAPVVGGTQVGEDKYKAVVPLKESDGDFDDEDDVYVGMGVAEFKVTPDWYPTAAKPADQDYTTCWAGENIQDSAVETDNGCGDSKATGTIKVAVGMGDECTITNTRFFEGIPTLDRYGLALMALLMLGMGVVGVRRFA